MIRYRDKEFKDYFINPYTAIVTDKFGRTVHRFLHKGTWVVSIQCKRMPIYAIQAHTYYGFRPDKIIHHIDGDRCNNVLFNLWYEWTSGQHTKYHNLLRRETQSAMMKDNKLTEGYRWYHNANEQCLAKECPEGWMLGKLPVA